MKTQIVYDPDATDSVVAEDREFVQAYCEVPDEDFDAKAMTPWVLRFVLNREVVADKKATDGRRRGDRRRRIWGGLALYLR